MEAILLHKYTNHVLFDMVENRTLLLKKLLTYIFTIEHRHNLAINSFPFTFVTGPLR